MAKADRHLAQFELLALLAIRRLEVDDDHHLTKIVHELEKKTSRWISVANVYTSLQSMSQKGYLESRLKHYDTPGPGRKTKKLYRLTELGEAELNLAIRDIFSMAEGVNLWGRVTECFSAGLPGVAILAKSKKATEEGAAPPVK